MTFDELHRYAELLEKANDGSVEAASRLTDAEYAEITALKKKLDEMRAAAAAPAAELEQHQLEDEAQKAELERKARGWAMTALGFVGDLLMGLIRRR